MAPRLLVAAVASGLSGDHGASSHGQSRREIFRRPRSRNVSDLCRKDRIMASVELILREATTSGQPFVSIQGEGKSKLAFS